MSIRKSLQQIVRNALDSQALCNVWETPKALCRTCNDDAKFAVRTRKSTEDIEYLNGWTAGAALVAGSSGPSLVDFWLRNRRHLNACDGSFIQGYRAALLTALDRRA
jgi:hypothetical protein